MKKIKLAVVGCAGRMGTQIIKELKNFPNVDLIAAVENKNSSFLNKKIKKIKIIHDKELAFKNADVVIWSKNPFSVYALVERVFIDGATAYNKENNFQPASDFDVGIISPEKNRIEE